MRLFYRPTPCKVEGSVPLKKKVENRWIYRSRAIALGRIVDIIIWFDSFAEWKMILRLQRVKLKKNDVRKEVREHVV